MGPARGSGPPRSRPRDQGVPARTPRTRPTAFVGGTGFRVPFPGMSTEIRATTILPAERRPVTLTTADGLDLVGELALPSEGRTPAGTLVTLHPLPTHGGFMDSHLYRKAAWRLPALADLAVLRFNTRGTASPAGKSQGEFDHAVGERYDVEAAIEYADFYDLPNRWLIGWSFGTDLALMYGNDPSIEGLILLSPPLRFARDEH